VVTLPIANTDRLYPVNPTKIIALGLNYRDHVAESLSVNVRGFTDEIPPEPILFPKTPNVLIGPEEPIVIPAFLEDTVSRKFARITRPNWPSSSEGDVKTSNPGMPGK